MNDIVLQLNTEIINKLINALYAFMYIDEEPTDDVIILKNELDEIRVEFNIVAEKNLDAIISDCSFEANISI